VPAPIQLTAQVGATRLVQWLDLLTRVSGVGVTPMHAVARATALAIARNPGLNVCASRGQLRNLPGVDLCLQVPGPDPEGDTRRAVYSWFRPHADRASVLALCREMQAGLALYSPESPLPPVSAIITGMEASGITVTHAPLPRGAACPLHLVINPIEQAPLAIHGAVVTRHLLTLGASFDARLVQVHEAARLLHEIKQLIEDPKRLETADQFSGNISPVDTSTELELPDPTETSVEKVDPRPPPTC